MTQPIEATTTAALSLGLQAASLRQQAIATNIANGGTIGYTPLRVSFEAQLGQARQAMNQTGRIDPLALAGVRPWLEAAPDANGQPAKVQLDAEVADMARNAIHYQALTQGLSRHLSLLAAAAADGRK